MSSLVHFIYVLDGPNNSKYMQLASLRRFSHLFKFSWSVRLALCILAKRAVGRTMAILQTW